MDSFWGLPCLSSVAPSSCPSGFYSPARATTCVPCPAGYACPDTGTKTVCDVGSYSESGETTCTPCDAGYQCPSRTSATSKSICPTGMGIFTSKPYACPLQTWATSDKQHPITSLFKLFKLPFKGNVVLSFALIFFYLNGSLMTWLLVKMLCLPWLHISWSRSRSSDLVCI